MSDIESQIRKTELKLSQLSLKERKLKNYLYSYSIPIWLAGLAVSFGSGYVQSSEELIVREDAWKRWLVNGLGLVLGPVLYITHLILLARLELTDDLLG